MHVSTRKPLALLVASLCALLGALVVFCAPALAAAPEAPETTAASEVSNTTAVLEGIVNPSSNENSRGYFEYAQGASCSGGLATSLEPETDNERVPIGTEVTGLRPRTSYTFCAVARNANGETAVGAPVTFTTTGIAATVTEAYAEAGSTSARLDAELSNGSTASYHFEYGATEALGASTPGQEVSSVDNHALVSAELAGLVPNTVYYARVTVESQFGPTAGAVFAFRTFATSDALVPDGRVYEMVTPVQNGDADIYAPSSGFTGAGEEGKDLATTDPFQTSGNGEAVTYVGDPVVGGNGSGGSDIHPGNQFLARRTASGWTQEVIAATGGDHSYYEAFSPELAVAILRAGNGYGETTALLPEAEALNGGYHVLYERNSETHGKRALFTQFTQPEPPGPYEFIPQFVGGSSDFSTKVFDANAALVPGAPAGSNVYESVSAHLSLVNVLPDGSIEPQAQAGGVEEAGASGEGSPEFSHAVSSDGSRIFWTGLGSHPNLYMREDGTTTVQLDASQAGGSGGHGHFWTASDNGERVFFTDEAAAGLTSNTVAGSGTNLYEYDVANGKLTDLTAGSDARVQGVLGTSEEGAYVYFAADGVLAPGAASGGCVVEYGFTSAKCNLYVRHDGVTKLIAQLGDEDGMGGPDSGYGDGGGSELHGDWREGLGHRTAQVSANGTLVFDSRLPLTGYRNEGVEEVYAYDPTGSSEGELICASCDPSGEPAVGQSQVGGMLPISNDPAGVLRAVSADGSRIFFDSNQGLLPQDTNGWLDVYEWERDGTGTCALSTDCLSLLSGGKSLSDSYLIAVSPNGDDVFVVTRAQLVGQDRNENYDVYDVRVDGTRPLAPPACSGTGCQGIPPAPAIFATPSSVTFEGVGNFPPGNLSTVEVKSKASTKAQLLAKALRACSKQPRNRRAACTSRARKRYGPKPKTRRAAKKTKRSAKGGK
jgi:hypothetical protein